MQAKLWTRDFTIITLGSAVSILGSSMADFAVSLLVLDYTGSALLYALFAVVFNLPFLVVPLIAGPLLDRFSRKKAIYILDYCASGMYLLLFLLLRNGYFNYIFLLCFCLVQGCVASVYNVAYDSFYPNLVSPGNLSKANSVSSMLYPLAALMTPVAAWAYETIGVAPLFLINALCFFTAACFEAAVRAQETHVSAAAEVPAERHRFRQDFREGMAYLRSEAGLLAITLYFFVSNFAGGMDTLAMPYFQFTPGLGAQLFSYVMAFGVAGRLVGGLIHYRVRFPAAKKFAIALFVYIAINFLGGSYLFLPVPLMLLFQFLIGILGVTSYNIRISATQSYVPDSHRGRFNGIFYAITTAGAMSGQLLAGALGDRFPIRAVVVGFACVGLLGTGIMVSGRRAVKQIYNRQV